MGVSGIIGENERIFYRSERHLGTVGASTLVRVVRWVR